MMANFDGALALLARVPRPPDAPQPSGATVDQIDQLERALQHPIPRELAAWLERCNGIVAGPGVLYGARATDPDLDIATARRAWPEWEARDWIPVASDGSGNSFVLFASTDSEDSAVYFVDCSDDPDRLAYVVASSLATFLRFLLEREMGEARWPFDSTYVLAEDPQIRDVEGAPLAWNA